MEDTTRLAGELQAKLAELDAKVAQYRRQVTDEFTSHLNGSLRGVSDPASYEVRKILNDSLSNYPSLFGPGAQLGLTKPPVVQNPQPRTSGRDHDELQGLFTPSYLPLLEDKVNTPASPPPQSPPLQPPQRAQPHPDSGAGATPNLQEPQSRPAPTRKDTASSVASDRSDTSHTTARRSALRRSSSTSVKSPRKVRFDVEGEQVPAGESPKAFSTSADSLFGKPGFVDDDNEPPPKKVSSVERLRLLGRRPYKTQEESEADAPPPDSNDLHASPPLYMKPRHKLDPTAPKDDGPGYVKINPNLTLKQLGKSIETTASDSDPGSFNEDVIPTINTKKWKSKLGTTTKSGQTAQTSQKTQPATSAPASAHSPTKTQAAAMAGKAECKQATEQTTPEEARNLEKGKAVSPKIDSVSPPAAAVDDDDEDMFQFDPDEGYEAAPKPQAPDSPDEDVDNDEVEDEVEDEAEDEVDEVPSPATALPPLPAANPRQSSGAKINLAEAIGSYKGKPIVMPVVKDARVYQQAASLGEFNSFVGSIHDGDLNSFRASVTGPLRLTSGSPKSFSERLAMEEAREALKGPRKQLQGSQGTADKVGQSAPKLPLPRRDMAIPTHT